MFGLPIRTPALRPDLEQDKFLLAPELPKHLGQCLPIESLVVDADAAPVRALFR